MNPPIAARVVIAVLMLASPTVLLADEKPTLQDALAAKVSFAWDENTFEQGVFALAAKLKADYPEFAIKISGEDLKLEGITRNQRIRGLKLEDAAVADILTALIIKADPNARGADPRDPALKLVWVIVADPADAKRQIVLITTRAGAKKRGEKLPAVFEKKAAGPLAR